MLRWAFYALSVQVICMFIKCSHFSNFCRPPNAIWHIVMVSAFFPVTAGLPVTIKGLAACLPLPSDVTVLLIHSR